MVGAAIELDEHAAGGGMRIGFARLNAPRAINALSAEMIEALLERLEAWARDPRIACVVLDGAGDRGFCAGGDVVRLREAMLDGDAGRAVVAGFYAREYRLDHLIHVFPKPVICWGHGIVMGGGMGLMAGASHRVVTEASRLAMPEITIGFYPDVGATWFLNRMPGRVGRFLGLTAAPLEASDALLLGLADHQVRAARQPELYQALLDAALCGRAAADHASVSAVLRRFEEPAAPEPVSSPVLANWSRIAAAMDRPDAAAMLDCLEGFPDPDDWLARATATLRAGSPTSACVIVEQLRRGRHLSLVQAFELELRLSLRFAAGHDFPEGVRALLVDKDREPCWDPDTLTDVDPAVVESYFDARLSDLPPEAVLDPAMQ